VEEVKLIRPGARCVSLAIYSRILALYRADETRYRNEAKILADENERGREREKSWPDGAVTFTGL
jgi:hypothetical protein